MFQLRDNKMPVRINLYFLAIQHVILMIKSCLAFTYTAKHVYYVHFILDIPCDCVTANLLTCPTTFTGFVIHLSNINVSLLISGSTSGSFAATLVYRCLAMLILMVSVHPNNSISK